MRDAAGERAVAAHLDEHGGDLEQRVGLGIEAAGLDVDDHGQEAAKARGEGDGRSEVMRDRARQAPGDGFAGAIGHHASAREFVATRAATTALLIRVMRSSWRGSP